MINEINNLREEIFCLKFELETLSDVLLRAKSERWVPGYLFSNTEFSHLARYELACKYVNGLEVLDIACGTGKGSYMMAKNGEAKKVLGCDLDSNAIRYASNRFQLENLSYKIENAQELTFENKFDVVISFETIEHLVDYNGFLKSVNKAMKPGGLFLISTPISNIEFDSKPNNPFHIQEWGFNSFQNLLQETFTIKKIFVQLYPYSLIKKDAKILRVLKKIFRVKDKLISQDSIIEEFTNQYSDEQLKIKNCGYQILLLEKK